MILGHISVERLRNLEVQKVALSPGLNLLVGNNAQGKSNFLEAVSLVCMARSFRQNTNPEMICFGESSCAVEAEILQAEGLKHLRIAMDTRFKYAFINRKKVNHITDYLEEAPPAVVFRSESLAIGRGSPDLRRQFLDQLLVGSSPSSLALLRRYQKALLQRNTALKRGWNALEMQGFEFELALTGLKIVALRQKLVEQLERIASSFQKEFKENLTLRYQSSLAGLKNLDEYVELLRNTRESDRQQGYTRKGPHRDDLDMELENRSIRRYGSQGQVRSVVLSLKVAEIEILSLTRGVKPVLILDDVSADLDESRRERLFDYIAKDIQAFVSTTEVNTLGLSSSRYSRYQVSSGRLLNPE